MLDLLECSRCMTVGFVSKTDLGHLCGDCIDELNDIDGGDGPLDTQFALARPVLDWMPETRVAPTVVVPLPRSNWEGRAS